MRRIPGAGLRDSPEKLYAERVDCVECTRLRAEHDRLKHAYLRALAATDAAQAGTRNSYD